MTLLSGFGIPVDLGVAILVLAFAMVIGYSGHRASLCGVAAVNEIIKHRRASMLISFGKAILWAALVSIILSLLMPGGLVDVQAWVLTPAVLLGGLIFGLGAATNNACAISTLTRIADGNAGLLLSLVGLSAGIFLHSFLFGSGYVPGHIAGEPLFVFSEAMTWIVFLGLSAFALREIICLYRGRTQGESFKNLFLSRRYKLAIAALLIGSSNAFLNHFGGTWSYTAALTEFLEGDLGLMSNHNFSLFLFGGVVAGMFVSSVQLKRFHFEVPDLKTLARHFFGGFLMGFGTALIPGGNDTVLFEYIPGLSPHGLPVFAVIVVGIYFGIKISRKPIFYSQQNA